jgi:hypothetical protein
MVWYVAVIIETALCGWIQLERRRIRRRNAVKQSALPPLHRAYGRLLGRIGSRGRGRGPRVPNKEARRRTGLVQFGVATAAMLPMLLFVLLDSFQISPVAGQLLAWPMLWLAPMLTLAPARLVAVLVAVWRGWLRLDNGDGGPEAAVPIPGSPPGSHDYVLPR